jgi:hypothetical protein
MNNEYQLEEIFGGGEKVKQFEFEFKILRYTVGLRL